MHSLADSAVLQMWNAPFTQQVAGRLGADESMAVPRAASANPVKLISLGWFVAAGSAGFVAAGFVAAGFAVGSAPVVPDAGIPKLDAN